MMKKALWILPVFVLAVSLGRVFAVQNPQPQEVGAVQGVVTRAGSKEPLSGVHLVLEGGVIDAQAMQSILTTARNAGIVIAPAQGASMSEITQMLSSAAAERGLPVPATLIQNVVNQAVGGRNWPKAVSDSDGRFVFRDIQPGRYTVRAALDGYFGKATNGVYPPSASIDVTVRGKEAEDASLSLVQGAIIGGRIYDFSGAAAANLNVQAFSPAYTNGFAQLQASVTKTTDDRGEYRLLWVPPGEYYVGVTPRAGPLAGASARIRTFYPGVTRLSEAIPVTVRGGEDLRGIDIGLREARGFRISGRVTSSVAFPTAAGALPTATLMLVSRSLDTPDDAGARTLGTFPLVSGTAHFEVLDVPSGDFELFARVPDPTGSGLTGFAWAHVPLDVWDGDVSNIVISVNSSVEVKGIVRSAGGVLPSNLRIVFLAADSPSKIPLYRLVATRGTPVEADGSFAASSIPPGRYRLGAISGLPEGFYVSDVRQNAASVFDSGFEVGSRTPGALEIFVSDAAGGVTGSVQDGPLERIAGATVVLIPDSNRLENRALTAIATTTASGQFVFRGVAPGPYRLLAFERIPPNAHQNLGFIRKHENRGHAVEVKPGGMVNVDLTILK